ncbi:hypothetical protein [Alkalihalobacillus sp. LMS39]|uniref:ComEC/Rec2 family competence protein n=1 Tax=Alkalihalobacillus sp. LMS39 TaxID=2924032 RepID=UPI001FB490A4|nr:hypothetical protein [Alkalihalobacillus sp. LMS39]UOE92308.1 hypothetical protein MM271_13710 [Alkalihalobacillus sp. LMS39]
MRIVLLGLVCFFSMQLYGCSTMEVSSTVTGESFEFEVDYNLSKDEIAFTYFDIPDGEATLIQSGEGGTVLIGTGHPSSQVDFAKRLHMFHVEKINSLILVNDEPEYSGNLLWLLDHYPVEQIIVPVGMKESIEKRYGIESDKITVWDVGVKEELLPSLETEVLYSGDDPYDSFVLVFTYGQLKTLYMGVANEKIEEQLTEQYHLKSAILKVADFGSDKGTSQLFLEEVDPQVAILFQKRGQTVSQDVIFRLQETWIDIYQTYKIGTVSIRSDLKNYEVLTVNPQEEFPSIITK